MITLLRGYLVQEEWQYAYNDYSGCTRQSRKYWGSGAGNETMGFSELRIVDSQAHLEPATRWGTHMDLVILLII